MSPKQMNWEQKYNVSSWFFFILFLTGVDLLRDGYSYDTASETMTCVKMQENKLLNNDVD